ncbi:MAG: hypothetical protein ACI9OH_001469 [Oleispira sp.]|jgi:hypothetical protein
MKQVIFLIFSILLSISSFADCGCEDQAIIELSYMSETDQKRRETFVTYWWPINYSKQPYSHDAIENEKIKGMSLEQQLNYRLKNNASRLNFKWKLLSKIEVLETPIIKTELDGDLSFKFAKQTQVVKPESIKEIVKIHSLSVGCQARYDYPKSDILNLLLNKNPDKIKKIIDDYGYEHYKLGYELTDEYHNYEFRFNYDGSCI